MLLNFIVYEVVNGIYCIYLFINSEELYELNAHEKAHRLWIDKEAIASMASADSHLENSILDVWSIIMNKKQLTRQTTRPSRFFFTTYAYIAILHAQKSSFKYQEFYRIVNIIDNLTLPKKPSTRYGDCATLLKRFFSKYLIQRGRPRAEEVKDFQTVYVKTDYQDNINLHDCGIYTMRHMETYYEAFLRTLRAKYAARILLDEDNLLRDSTLHKAKLEARARQQQ
ncbi:hypothetical protein Cgig2_014240 [Carnegiea gigantea]|uniref:Ubiquitin-like protease family profile domain-containing protein n=1 Tax=Carnegiea gigantea TaxID=171969 RepID=A0A9Q1K0A2_9CARY|nr:hypothetical protein Cgig2_014240 [Carnegiea gigantea]